jgi:transposase
MSMKSVSAYYAVMEKGQGGVQDEAVKSPVRLRQPQHNQLEMRVQCPDDLVAAEHPVRMVAAVVERLNITRFAEPIRAREGTVGRDATDPGLLISLWLYACMRGIGLARELARRCEESKPFLWLCGGVSVNHRLLSDFRTDPGEALGELLTQVIASLVEQGVIKVSRISQDGVRVRVGAGAASFRREERLQKLLEECREHVAAAADGCAGEPGESKSQTVSSAKTAGGGKAETAGASHRAVAGVEEEAGRSVPASRARQIRR